MVDSRPIRDGCARRRTLLKGAMVAGVGMPVLIACGSDSDDGDESEGFGPPAGTRLSVKPADVPRGGGVVLRGEQLVVTQPTAGDFRVFSAICTHQGCMVGTVADGAIICPCHNSMYDIATGQVVGGPAPRPLAERPVTVDGGQITLA
jgi:Rieske Fe-S protein